MHLNKKMKVVITGLVLSLAAAGAYAYWTGTGSGTGTGTVAAGGGVTLHGTVAAGLAPGLSRIVTFTADNGTTAAVRITTVQLASITSNIVGCDMSAFTMPDVAQPTGPPPFQVPAGGSAFAVPTTGLLTMANTDDNQDACKGAALTLNLTSS